MERHNLESKMLDNRLKLVTRSERENRNLCLSLTKVAQDDPQIENTDIFFSLPYTASEGHNCQ